MSGGKGERMGLLDWLRKSRSSSKSSALAPAENYPADEKRILLKVAGQIRAARGNSLEELTTVAFGLGSTIAALRRAYGAHAVEANCPAEQLISGFGTTSDAAAKNRANELLVQLLNDLRAFEGDENRTWMRMAWMLNPSCLEGAWKDNNRNCGEGPQGRAMRERVLAALNTVGVESDTEADDDQFCISAAVGIARAVMDKVGTKPQTYDHDDAFVGGLFVSVAVDYLTQKIGGTFELVGVVAVPLLIKPSMPSNPTKADIEKVSEQMAEFTTQILTAHNKSPRTGRSIGDNLSRWLEDPSELHFLRLVGIFQAAQKRVRIVD